MKNSTAPMTLFAEWFAEEDKHSDVNISTAVCLSTIGTDGYPNARIVSLKEVVDNCFIITGSLSSRKGLEIEANAKVALTFWWTQTERQVRVQGVAAKISNDQADYYFKQRDISSQAVSKICEQGKEIDDLQQLELQITEIVSGKTKLKRPKNWGGFSVKPTRIEFMEFKSTRFHIRTLYEIEDKQWTVKHLQP